jgi:hypothetical protein
VRLVAQEAVKRRLVPRVGRETIRILLLSHDLKPWLEQMWVVADLDENYIAKMEDVLETYEQPYDPAEPVFAWMRSRSRYTPMFARPLRPNRGAKQGPITSSMSAAAQPMFLRGKAESGGVSSWNRRMNRDRVKIAWKFARKAARRRFGYNRNSLSGHRPRPSTAWRYFKDRPAPLLSLALAAPGAGWSIVTSKVTSRQPAPE